MNFAEKCNHIFDILKCTNAEIARESRIDPSLISRFRTGMRKPGSNSSQFLDFCRGITTYAEKTGQLKKLFLECTLPDLAPPEDEICKYLVGKETVKNQADHNTRKSSSLYNMFSEKLSVIMNMLDISNIRLARFLNVDTSLISRFRNGLRIPSKNSALIISICNYFYKVFKTNGMEAELFDMFGKPELVCEKSTDEIIKIFHNWLLAEEESNHAGIMDSFFEKIDTLSQINIPSHMANIGQPLDIVNEHSDEYHGLEGLRQAVLRFLGKVAASDNQATLKLYSDQNLQWLSSDPVFTHKWVAMMYAVLLKKHPIKIIHNLDRNINEMLIGIEKWLPLYMSGIIEGYYCKNTYDSRFSHTLFVASELAAIQGSHVLGTEDDGIYHYANEPERIHYYEKQFDTMFEMSKPLIQVFKRRKAPDFHFVMSETLKLPGNIKRLLLSPSLSTISAELLHQMLIRSGIDKQYIESILTVYNITRKSLTSALKSGHIMDYVVFPEDEALFNERIKLNLADTFAEFDLYYTPEEYSEHVKSLIVLLENDNYDIIPLPDSPFANIQMSVKENATVMVQKTDIPVTAFRFNHPLMCKAISEYIDIIGRNSMLNVNNKADVIKFLSRYLR